MDFDRLRRDRLRRARLMMEKHDLGALVCFVGENVRYISGVFQGNWKNNIFIASACCPGTGSRCCSRRRAQTWSARRSTRIELQEGMYFACEMFSGHPGLEQTARLEENLLVRRDGPVSFTKYPFADEALV